MSDYEQAIFICHPGGGERQEIVIQIDQELQTRGCGMVCENTIQVSGPHMGIQIR